MAYTIEWSERAVLEQKARKRGWDGEDHLLDFVEPGEALDSARAASLDAALKIAKAKVEIDLWGEVRIAKTKIIISKYGVEDEIDVAVWNVYSETETLDPHSPDYRPDKDD